MRPLPSSHRKPPSISVETMRQKTPAVPAIRRDRRVTGAKNGQITSIDAIEKAGSAWALAQYNLGFRVGSGRAVTEILSRREAIAANRFREALAGGAGGAGGDRGIIVSSNNPKGIPQQ